MFKKLIFSNTICKRVKGGLTIKEESLFLRNQSMVDSLVKEGKIQVSEVERAFRTVKRHHFLSGIVPPVEVYKNQAIMIKGRISSSSQPHVMAMMLEELELKKGLKVLEIGTASGYNAALIAEIVGRSDLVYTMELEADLAERASQILRNVGYPGVTVIAGDGRKGYPPGASYDRIIVTAGAESIYPQLIRQLDQSGIILIPFNFYDFITITLKLRQFDVSKYRGSLVGFPVKFVPIRGMGEEKKMEKKFGLHYRRLTDNLLKSGLDISHRQIIGLVLLMIAKYNEDQLEKPRDYRNLIEQWRSADKPGIGDFEFEYNSDKDEWQLIPIF